MTPERKAEAFHITEFLAEEMQARGWTRDRLAHEMTKYDYGINRLSLDMLFADAEPGDCRIGEDGAKRLGHAFGVDPQFFLNLEAAWIKSRQ